MIEGVLWLARAVGLFALSRRLTRHRLRILCYHGIWMGPAPHFGDRLFMSPERFEMRMHSLRDQGWEAVPLDQAWHRCREGRLTGREFVITIDDGWAGTAVHMRPVLKAMAWPSTLYLATRDFLVGAPVPPVTATWLLSRAQRPFKAAVVEEASSALEARVRTLPDGAAQEAEWRRQGADLRVDVDAVLHSRSLNLMSKNELRQCQADGMAVQLHTHTHDLGDMTPAVIAQELSTNRQVLSELLGVPPEQLRQFCYPSGVHDPKAFASLAALGIETATTTDFGLPDARCHPMALPRILDGESMSALAFEARMSGFWYLLNRLLGRST